MARNPGLRLPVLSLPFLLLTFCVEGSVAQRSAPALAQLTPGLISTVAGEYYTPGSSFSGDGGPATNAQMWNPEGMALDSQGNLYIADSSNNVIQVVNMQSTAITLYGVTIEPGDINTVAGDTVNSSSATCAASTDDVGDGCPPTQAALIGPAGLSLDSAGNLYIAEAGDLETAEYGASRIRKVSAATGVISTAAGDGNEGYSGDGGDPLDAELDDPESLEVDAAGNIYISDLGNNRVRVVNTQSSAITVFGVAITLSKNRA